MDDPTTVGDVEANKEEKFTFFYSKNYEFSNWFHCNKLKIAGIQFSCTEQYYMYRKALLFNDYRSMKKILETNNPRKIKQLGRSVYGFQQNIWDKISYKIMKKANYEKVYIMVLNNFRISFFQYKQNRELRQALLKTRGTTLAEASLFDKRWGIGMSIDNPLIFDRKNWKGKNMLGNILTTIRNEFENKEKQTFISQ